MTELSSGVTEDLVEKAAAEIFRVRWEMAPQTGEHRIVYANEARAVLAAVVPEVRRQVAREISEAIQMYNQEWSANTWRSIASGIAREIGGVQ